MSAEVEGVSPLAMGEFSSRSADIRRHMAEWGAHTRAGARIAWAATRLEKVSGLDFGELSSQWEWRARSIGSDRAEIQALLGRAARNGGTQSLDEHRFGATLSLAPDGAAVAAILRPPSAMLRWRVPTRKPSRRSRTSGRPSFPNENRLVWLRTLAHCAASSQATIYSGYSARAR